MDEDVVAHLAQHHNLLVWFVCHGVHHGVQQLDRGIKVILLAILTAQVWDANLQFQNDCMEWFFGELPTRLGVQHPRTLVHFFYKCLSLISQQ